MTNNKFRFVVESDPTNYEQVRQKIASRMTSRFDGWDNDFDRQFDWHSRFFLLYLNDELVAGLRLVLSGHYWPQSQLPCALSNHDVRLEVGDYQHVGEFSGLWFSDAAYGIFVCGMGSKWGLEHLDTAPIYAVYEQGNAAIEHLYKNIFGLEVIDDRVVRYNTFVNKQTQAPVHWVPAVDYADTRKARVDYVLGLSEVAEISKQILK